MVPALVCNLSRSLTLCLLTHHFSHIDWHLQVGLAVVFVEDIADVSSANTPTCESPTFWAVAASLIRSSYQPLGATCAPTIPLGGLLDVALSITLTFDQNVINGFSTHPHCLR